MTHSRAPLTAALLFSLAVLASGCATRRTGGPAGSDAIAIERSAWGAFHTEFYPTYDFIPVWKETRAKALGTGTSH